MNAPQLFLIILIVMVCFCPARQVNKTDNNVNMQETPLARLLWSLYQYLCFLNGIKLSKSIILL